MLKIVWNDFSTPQRHRAHGENIFDLTRINLCVLCASVPLCLCGQSFLLSPNSIIIPGAIQQSRLRFTLAKTTAIMQHIITNNSLPGI